MVTTPDVIVIGAGAAGLAAAKRLAEIGHEAIVIEASHRIGGRAYSEEIAPGVWFDLGCSYLHNGDTNPFVGIAAQLGHVIGPEFGDLFSPEKIRIYRDGKPLDPQERQAYDDYVDRCAAVVHRPRNPHEDAAIAELIDLEHDCAPAYANLMASILSRDIDLASAADEAAFLPGPDIPLRDGYGNLVAAWGADVAVELNSRAERIDWSGPGVSVTTPRGTLKARCALCTVSTGILGANRIRFAPTLPDWKLAAVAGLPMGTLNKVCLHFDRDVFGPDGRGFFQLCSREPGASGFEASVMGQDTAVLFNGGRHAVWLEQQGPQAAHDYALEQVAAVFGNGIRRYVTRSIATAWATEPWTLGAYSCALPGQAEQRHALARPLADRLFFAGEATRIEDHACCHGAYWSGIRAADEISQRLDN